MNPVLQPILKQLKQDLMALYGDRLVHLTLFGSQARGDQEPDSDIDVLVVLRSSVNPGEEIKRTGKIIADLSLHYDVVISCLFMDETDYRTRNNALLRNIRREGVLLWPTSNENSYSRLNFDLNSLCSLPTLLGMKVLKCKSI